MTDNDAGSLRRRATPSQPVGRPPRFCTNCLHLRVICSGTMLTYAHSPERRTRFRLAAVRLHELFVISAGVNSAVAAVARPLTAASTNAPVGASATASTTAGGRF